LKWKVHLNDLIIAKISMHDLTLVLGFFPIFLIAKDSTYPRVSRRSRRSRR
jgi:hypothetical protein